MKAPIIAVAFAVLTVLGAAGTAHAAKKLYKWVDDKGQTHYTETIPPEAVNKSSTEIDRRGRQIKQNQAAPKPEEIKAEQDQAEQRKIDEKKAYEQHRRDNALMNTYTSEAEIDTARERNLSAPMAMIKGLEPRLKVVQTRFDGLKRNADALVKAGKPVPAITKEDMAAAEHELAQIDAEYKAKQTEIQRISDKYAADKTRYRELAELLKK